MCSFHNAERQQQCVFCGKGNHKSRDCYKARGMPYEEKMEILKKNRLCFGCCGHHLRRNCRKKLECSICKGGHEAVVCREVKRKHSSEPAVQPQQKRLRTEATTTSSNSNMECSGDVALQTLMVKIGNGDKMRIVRAFVDGGCQRSYILKKTAKELSLKKVGMERVVHSLFGDNRTPTITHNKYKIQIGDLQNNFHQVFVVRDSDKLCGRLPTVEKRVQLRDELHNKNVVLTDVGTSSEIELLIGGDVYAQIITGEICRLECGATAINTKLGWTLLGNVGDDEGGGESLSSMYLSMAVTDADITKLWDLETLGIREPAEEAVIKKKIELAREQYISNSIIKEDGKYVVKLPWKDDLPLLPTNRDVAFKRLQSASKKLQEKGLFGAYQQLLIEWEKEGFIERVRRDDNAARLHYFPHRAVKKPESLTTPVRPVFDASCRVGKSPSLNDCLFTGENLVQLIPGIHLLLREKKVGFVSDIRKAFQMIGVAEEDRDMMRFLFWEDEKMEKVVEYRHARVMFGATCSPFILAAVICHHLTNLQEEEKEMGMRLLSTLYVDNCAYSVDTPAEYFHFREKATELMKRAGMELRLWMSNVDEIEDETTRGISVLGLQWDRSSDELFVNVKKVSVPEKVTKRVILSSIQKIFDPIGFTAPCVLPMKILLQRTWLNKMKWDEELPEPEGRKFISWCHEAETMDKIRIPRVFSNGESDRRKWALHIFVDACKDSYAAAVFLRVEEENSVSVQLLAAKSRVAPVKKMTIPKLELMGCLVGVRLVTSIKNSLKMDGVPEYFWSDSTTALAWIRRNEMWGTFVGNRTKEINQLSKAEDWRHVPGEQNPADLPSRGCSPEQLFRSRWWEGPKWLCEDESGWPSLEENYDEQEISAERRKTALSSCVVSFSILDRVQNSHSFESRVRIIGWVRRFLHNYLMKKADLRRNGDLTKDELNKAELAMIKQIQKEEFPEEGRSRFTGLEIIQDDWGILRVKTRLTHRKDLGSFRFPILLPNKREEIRQLIRDNHRMYCHAGVGFLTTKLRTKFWILKARHTVKGVISKCHRCRRYAAKSVIPEPAPLPLDRVKEAEVFEVVGVDLAGPLILKDGGKAWMVIFTCAVYRAVHLELVRKISTRAFINVLEKFSEKFRRPAIIYSDNGTNFRGADNLFKRIDWDNVGQHETIAKIEWRFSPPTSSWWGGFWERLIRTVKDLLKRTVGKGSLCWSELVAVLKTVEDVMNEPPLTYVSENPEDLEPLTPALFLHPFGNARLPEAELSAAENLRFRLNYVTTLRRELKSRFLREYLSLLVNRKPKKPTRELKKGELVFVGSDNTKRVEWPLGRIVEFLSSRVVKVKTAGGIFVRSVQRLYPLEADGESKEEKSVREYGVRTRSGRDVRRPARFE